MTTFSVVQGDGAYVTSTTNNRTIYGITAGNILVAFVGCRDGKASSTMSITDDNSGTWNYIDNANDDNELGNNQARIAIRKAWRVVEAGENGENLVVTGHTEGNNNGTFVVEIEPSAAFDPSVLANSATGSGTTTLDGVSTSTGSISGSDLLHVFLQGVRVGGSLTYVNVDEYTITTEYERFQYLSGSNGYTGAIGVAMAGQTASGVVTVTSDLGGANAPDAEGIIAQIVFEAAATGNNGSGGVTAPVPTLSGTGTRTSSGTGAISTPLATLSGSASRGSVGSGNANLHVPVIAGASVGAKFGIGAIDSVIPSLSGSGVRASAGTGAIAGLLPSLNSSGVRGSSGSGGVTTPVPAIAGTDVSGSGVSDDFNTGTLDTSRWTTVNQPGNTTVQVNDDDTDAWLELIVPDGTNRDLYNDEDLPTAVYCWQDWPGGDLDLRVRFLSTPDQNAQGLGITLVQDVNNYVRCDFDYNGSNYFGWASRVVAGNTSQRVNVSFGSTWYPYLRVTQPSAGYLALWRSPDGVNWTQVGADFNQGWSTINKVGVHIISTNDSTGFTAKFDWFEDYLNDPISDEDAGLGANTGSGGVTTPLATLSGTGVRGSVGTGAITSLLPALSGSGAGANSGSGAITSLLPALSGSGARGLAGTGAITSLIPTLSSSGVRGAVGSGAIDTPLPAIAGTSTTGASGSGAITTPSPSLSGAGSRASVGTGSVVAPVPTVSGAGSKEISGSGSVAAPLPALSGLGSVGAGTGAVTAPLPSLNGSATRGSVGSGSATLPTPSLGGSGSKGATGSGAVVAPMPIVSGTGGKVISGTGAVVLPLPVIVGSSGAGKSGSGAISSPAPSISGSGVTGKVGVGHATTPTPAINGSGATSRVGTGAIALPAPSLSGAGLRSSVGSGSVVLPLPVIFGAELVGGVRHEVVGEGTNSGTVLASANSGTVLASANSGVITEAT